ncbi:MAG: iron ABC transporter substrate-binding protein [Trebonia sp.]|uniref:iron ABC transporter substrate-binding protein n=1 Tax=Trebonia sp. TaxID=2767075 RepID=UPI003BB14F2E
MRKAWRVIGMAVTAGMLTASVAACGASSGGDAPANRLVLYNGQHEQTTQALVSAFEKQTGIQVTVRNGDEDQLAEQIMQEGSRSPGDVFYTENSPALMKLAGQHLLAPVDKATLAAVPSADSSPAGNWVGVTARISALVYNTNALKPSQLPTSVMDLANPKWAGKLGIAPGETDFQPIITSIADTHGSAAALAWLKGVKANAGSHIYPDNETLTSEVNSGQVEIGLINHYYWYRLRAGLGAGAMHSALHYFAPGDPGYVLNVSGAGILASSTHQAAAQKFLAFLISAAGQRIIAQSDSFEYPLRPGVAANSQLPPLSSLHPDPADTIAKLGDGSTALQLLQQAQLG